jgi:GNAT superfamily N-acetyltransferase
MLTIRDAQKPDAALIVEYIRELAAFEKLSHECVADSSLLEKWLFTDTPRAGCVMLEWEGKPAGFTLYFYSFSTFLTKPGIYIEDVYVRPDFRRKGIGKQVFQYFAEKTLDEGCGRLEWSVLDWNKDAIALYESIGAVSMNGWTIQRVTGEALKALASS